MTWTITADDVDLLEDLIDDPPGPVAVDVEGMEWEALNQVRYHLSQMDLEAPAEIEGDEGVVDELLEWVVERLALEQPGLRMRAPDTLTDGDWRHVQDHVDPDSDFLFYIDGFEEPHDSGLLYDRFEAYLFDTEVEEE